LEHECVDFKIIVKIEYIISHKEGRNMGRTE